MIVGAVVAGGEVRDGDSQKKKIPSRKEEQRWC
jgi:hypothetical protein